jgi:ribonuclease P/MRP protein subunit RPP40
MITADGKNKAQVEAAVHKASWILGRIRRTFKYYDTYLFKKLYPTFVRPHLEFASAAWNNMPADDVAKLESVQHKATKMVEELKGYSYYERLRVLGITELESRRKTGDLIQIYKLANRLEEVNIGLRKGNRGDRSHTSQIVREICKERWESMGRNRFSTNRTATTWNLLPTTVVNVKSVNNFKAALDNHMTAGRLRRSVYQT